MGDESLFVGEVGGAGRLAGVEGGEELLHRAGFGLDLVVAGVFGQFFDLGVTFFHGIEVGQQKLGVDDVDVMQRIDAACNVDDLGVVEAADDMADGVGGTDVAEELIS